MHKDHTHVHSNIITTLRREIPLATGLVEMDGSSYTLLLFGMGSLSLAFEVSQTDGKNTGPHDPMVTCKLVDPEVMMNESPFMSESTASGYAKRVHEWLIDINPEYRVWKTTLR